MPDDATTVRPPGIANFSTDPTVPEPSRTELPPETIVYGVVPRITRNTLPQTIVGT